MDNKNNVRILQYKKLRPRKFYNNYLTKFQRYEKELNSFADKPVIRNSSVYISEEDARKKEILENKKKWLVDKDFKRVFGKNTESKKEKEEFSLQYNYIENLNESIKGRKHYSVLRHEFRSVDKSKWISNKNFKL